METRNRVYTALNPNKIHNDHELSSYTGLSIEDTRYHLSKLVEGGLINEVKKVRVKRKVYHVYETKQQRLFDD